ncbi:MAG: hypothetical protein K0U76_01380 [Actinomycetia bacterium]|nr:hypothetical protein [Actinomycetes bacterium]MCH9700034.1 hypothetical protein [Actinomycetes bacterium]MCH9761983.1 hypothetical protein [Actinomycetes bacterium]
MPRQPLTSRAESFLVDRGLVTATRVLSITLICIFVTSATSVEDQRDTRPLGYEPVSRRFMGSVVS